MTHPNRKSSLRQHLRALAQREGGVSYAEVTGFATSQVSSALWRLKSDGEVFAAKLSHRVARYFGNEEAARRYEATHRRQASSNGTATSETGRHIGGVAKHQKAWWPSDAPMVMTEKTKVIQAPPPPQPTKTNTFTEWGG